MIETSVKLNKESLTQLYTLLYGEYNGVMNLTQKRSVSLEKTT
jgi:hypothetical protein